VTYTASNCVNPIIYTTYAVIARIRFVACGSEVLPIFLFFVFALASAKRKTQRRKSTPLPKAETLTAKNPLFSSQNRQIGIQKAFPLGKAAQLARRQI
jgi:hypothetical protein